MQMHASRQLRFMARGAIFSLAMVALWYWALLSPLLGGLRLATDFTLRLLPGSQAESRIVEDSKGDWTALAPVGSAGAQAPAWLSRNIPGGNGSVRIRAIKVRVSRSTLSLFTLAFPLYWAFILAAPRGAHFWRALTLGTVLIAIIALVSTLVQVAQTAAPYLQMPGRWAEFALEVAAYLGRAVAPYIAPLVIAITLLQELRSLVFPWEMVEDRLPGVHTGDKRQEEKRARHAR